MKDMHTYILTEIAKIKWALRQVMRLWHEICWLESQFQRFKHIYELEHSPFYTHRIQEMEHHIQDCDDTLREDRRFFAICGRRVMQLCASADRLLSEQEQASFIGISHHALQQLKQRDTHLYEKHEKGYPLIAIIFASKAEHFPYTNRKDRKGYIDGDDMMHMPLWVALDAAITEEFLRNPDFQEAMSKEFDKMFPWIPRYQSVILPDGTMTMKRLPPPLQVLEGGQR